MITQNVLVFTFDENEKQLLSYVKFVERIWWSSQDLENVNITPWSIPSSAQL